MKNTDYVTASEIGEYVYCKRGWWLRQNDLLPTTPEMLQGTIEHNRLASLLWWHKILLAIGIVLLGLSLIGLIIYFFINGF
jgi:hypothetical protein